MWSLGYQALHVPDEALTPLRLTVVAQTGTDCCGNTWQRDHLFVDMQDLAVSLVVMNCHYQHP
jgi:hypothetical protein